LLTGTLGLNNNILVAQEQFEKLENAAINNDSETFKSEIQPTLVRGAWVLGQIDFLMDCNVWDAKETKEVVDIRSDLAYGLQEIVIQCSELFHPDNDLCDIDIERQAILKTCSSWFTFDIDPGINSDLIEIREEGIDTHIADRAFSDAQWSWDNHIGYSVRAPQILKEVKSGGFCHSYDTSWEQNNLDATIRNAEWLRDNSISKCERDWGQWIDC